MKSVRRGGARDRRDAALDFFLRVRFVGLDVRQHHAALDLRRFLEPLQSTHDAITLH
ncbi:MAG: hypothetical protein HYY17_07765 [Planctomycetes bacterium]|nr:hypothetical protein [Planctomycetota bacterium]